MAKKIILFLSAGDWEKRPKNRYVCRKDTLGFETDWDFEGQQTNEAPVKAMLAAHPDIDSIICIVTQSAKDTNSVEFFKNRIKEFAAGTKCKITDDTFKIVKYDETKVFAENGLEQVLKLIEPGYVKEDGDEILLETTGGLRDTMMYLLLLIRILRYNRNTTIGATYANNQSKEIIDIMPVINMFDLVGGVQEMTSFGNVRTLRSYFGNNPTDWRIGKLLSAMEDLNEVIMLCRTKQIDTCMKKFNDALEAVGDCSDPLMRALIPAFRSVFSDKKLTTVGLIRWCLGADMLQQAMTIYTERIPSVIFGRKILMMGKATQKETPHNYEDENAKQFVDGFLRFSHSGTYGDKYDPWNDLKEIKEKYGTAKCVEQILTIEDMEHYLPESSYSKHNAYTIKQIQCIARDYLYIKQLRNAACHANETNTDDVAGLVNYLCDKGYRKIKDVDSEYIKKTVNTALKRLTPVSPKDKRG